MVGPRLRPALTLSGPPRDAAPVSLAGRAALVVGDERRGVESGPLGGGALTSYTASVWIDALRRLTQKDLPSAGYPDVCAGATGIKFTCVDGNWFQIVKSTAADNCD